MFCSVINCLYICVCACLLQNNMRMYIQINIHRSKVLCGSAFEPGGSGLPYYCTPPVCVPAVLGALAVWRLSTAQKKNHTHTHTLKVQSLPCAWFRSRSLSFFLVRWSVICYQHGCFVASPKAHCPKSISVTNLTSTAWEDTGLICCLSYPSWGAPLIPGRYISG